MRPIHIFTHEFRPKRGGAGVVCEKIALTLLRSGREVTVWTPEYVDDDSIKALQGLTIERISGLKGTRNPGCLWATVRAILKQPSRFRNAIVYLGDPGPIAVWFYLVIGVGKIADRLILTLHGSELERYQRNPISRALFKNLLGFTDRVHVLSSYNEDRFCAWFPDHQSKRVKGFGMLVPGEVLPELTVRNEPADRLNLLCVGRIHPRKGQGQILAALSHLSRDEQERVELRFVGQFVKNRYYETIRKQADALACEIQFTGGVSDSELEAAYRWADAFVMASMPYGSSVEGLGLVYLEASRYALPIIANRIGGVEDVVIDGDNGLLADPDNVISLTEHIRRVLSDIDLREKLGERARARVVSCSWQRVTDRLFDA
jgi:phosphatidylinositol alpha-1,6-mannosyltransferase